MEIKQELEQSNYLVELYIKLFTKRFGTKPIFEDGNPQFDQVRNFKRMGGDRSVAIMEHYFLMDDNWFTNQGYSIPCLVKNINRVSAALSSSTPKTTNDGRDLIARLYCDNCDLCFIKTVKQTHQFSELALCPHCFNFFSHKLNPFTFEGLQKYKREMSR